VHEPLRLLIELQAVDTLIIAKSRALKDIPVKLRAVERALSDFKAGFEKEKEGLASLEKKKRDKERELAESSERAAKLRARTAEIKDNKAYQAHLKEIEAAEKHSYQIEDEILAAMEALEEESKRLKEAGKGTTEAEVRAAAEKKALEEEMRAAEAEMDALRSRRKEFTTPLDKDAYGLYMDLLQHAGGLAVTEARDEVCTGCNMNIMPQLFVELKKNESIVQCPQCRRILFYRGPTGPPGELAREPAEQPQPPEA
jgi:hypothetical protein